MIKIRRILQAARETLGADIVFLSQFVDDERMFRYVDALRQDGPVQEGGRDPLEDTHCKLIVSGALPPMIPDTSKNLIARALPITRALQIDAFLGVPIRLSDGTLFGTFCCISHAPLPALVDRDLVTLQAFAALAAEGIEQELRVEQTRTAMENRIRGLLAKPSLAIVYQPVFMLEDMRLAGAEALSRFPSEPGRSPDLWFKEAAEIGLQVEFELLAIHNALIGFTPVWAKHRVQLGLNASVATILDERLSELLGKYPRELIVIELTEHEEVADYPALLAAVSRLRAGGTKIAIDDVGAGYASMRHVLTLRPDILKLDVGLIRSVDADDLRLALVSSLKHFADQFSCRVVAEGIETAGELDVVRDIGLQAAQGYLLGRPAPVEALLASLQPLPTTAAPRSRPPAR